jgi:chromosome segregation ATPase
LSSILVEQEEALEGERQSHVEAAQRIAHAESRLVARSGSTAAISVTSSPVKGGLMTTPQKQEQLQSGRSPGGDRVKQLMVELQGIEARRDEEVAALTEELERARLDIEHLRGERDALLAELEQARARVSDLERSERDADARVSGVVGDARARALSAEQAVKDAEARASAADLASSSAERRLAEVSTPPAAFMYRIICLRLRT